MTNTAEQIAMQIYIEADHLLRCVKERKMSGRIAETALIIAAAEVASIRSAADGNLEGRIAHLQRMFADHARFRCEEYKRRKAVAAH